MIGFADQPLRQTAVFIFFKHTHLFQLQPFSQACIYSALRHIQIGVGTDRGDPILRQQIGRGTRQKALQWMKNDRMMADDQLCAHLCRLTYHLRRNIQCKQGRMDLCAAVSHEQARIVKPHRGMKWGKCVNQIIKLSNRCHNQSLFSIVSFAKLL